MSYGGINLISENGTVPHWSQVSNPFETSDETRDEELLVDLSQSSVTSNSNGYYPSAPSVTEVGTNSDLRQGGSMLVTGNSQLFISQSPPQFSSTAQLPVVYNSNQPVYPPVVPSAQTTIPPPSFPVAYSSTHYVSPSPQIPQPGQFQNSTMTLPTPSLTSTQGYFPSGVHPNLPYPPSSSQFPLPATYHSGGYPQQVSYPPSYTASYPVAPQTYPYPSPSHVTPTFGMGNAQTSPSSFGTQQKISIIQNPTQLESLGVFKLVSRNEPNYQLIAKYIYNSIGVSPHRVKVHSLFQLSRWSLPFPSFIWSDSNKVLLFSKTTPESVRKLVSGENSCVAFYDRISRALAINPGSLETSFRQIILICSVSLGNMLEHRNGYKIWSCRDLPQNQDSILGVGRLVPDSRDYAYISSTFVPFGKTVDNMRYPTYDLDFNEYLVYFSQQIKVEFAVDIEVGP